MPIRVYNTSKNQFSNSSKRLERYLLNFSRCHDDVINSQRAEEGLKSSIITEMPSLEGQIFR